MDQPLALAAPMAVATSIAIAPQKAAAAPPIAPAMSTAKPASAPTAPTAADTAATTAAIAVTANAAPAATAAGKPAPQWYETLADSVCALGAAAREYRAAHQAACVYARQAEPTRLLPVGGSLGVLGSGSVRPHAHALWQLTDLYGDLATRTRDLYDKAALLYAYGTASALQRVLNGERPHRVEARRLNGRYVPPGDVLPDLRQSLADWPESARLAALRDEVLRRERDAAALNGLFTYDEVPDHGIATALADSAYAYGSRAEAALFFVLLTRTEASGAPARAHRIPTVPAVPAVPAGGGGGGPAGDRARDRV
ncbi:hypothetical protein AB0M39_11460 [Streptomyces sp. NPDC051907]|uniref:hypothetical protein n=1 Tax=Streptomyces sp. NPDC051907 TaxID=3155284 RepID=UPI003439C4D6